MLKASNFRSHFSLAPLMDLKATSRWMMCPWWRESVRGWTATPTSRRASAPGTMCLLTSSTGSWCPSGITCRPALRKWITLLCRKQTVGNKVIVLSILIKTEASLLLSTGIALNFRSLFKAWNTLWHRIWPFSKICISEVSTVSEMSSILLPHFWRERRNFESYRCKSLFRNFVTYWEFWLFYRVAMKSWNGKLTEISFSCIKMKRRVHFGEKPLCLPFLRIPFPSKLLQKLGKTWSKLNFLPRSESDSWRCF